MKNKRCILSILTVFALTFPLFGCGTPAKEESIDIVPEELQCATAEDGSYVCCILNDGKTQEPLFVTESKYTLPSSLQDTESICTFHFTKLYDGEKMGIEWFREVTDAEVASEISSVEVDGRSISYFSEWNTGEDMFTITSVYDITDIVNDKEPDVSEAYIDAMCLVKKPLTDVSSEQIDELIKLMWTGTFAYFPMDSDNKRL